MTIWPGRGGPSPRGGRRHAGLRPADGLLGTAHAGGDAPPLASPGVVHRRPRPRVRPRPLRAAARSPTRRSGTARALRRIRTLVPLPSGPGRGRATDQATGPRRQQLLRRVRGGRAAAGRPRDRRCGDRDLRPSPGGVRRPRPRPLLARRRPRRPRHLQRPPRAGPRRRPERARVGRPARRGRCRARDPRSAARRQVAVGGQGRRRLSSPPGLPAHRPRRSQFELVARVACRLAQAPAGASGAPRLRRALGRPAPAGCDPRLAAVPITTSESIERATALDGGVQPGLPEAARGRSTMSCSARVTRWTSTATRSSHPSCWRRSIVATATRCSGPGSSPPFQACISLGLRLRCRSGR